ncbi:hypothetical protein DRP04_04710 [Archaeoglobales archaeon]|nr:MAG: hypothetical protein DRP04_04710 [Archaeoglobales archaeon]
MAEEDLETYERVTKIANITTLIGVIASVFLNIWVIISLMSDLFGIDFGEWAREIIEYGWRLPPNWVQQYQSFLTTLQWVLLVTVITDTAVSYRYMVEGEPKVPLSYQRIVSFIGFFCGMWLYLAYHVTAYGLIFFASFVTFTWTMFVKEERAEEEKEEFEPEVWKETASIFNKWW